MVGLLTRLLYFTRPLAVLKRMCAPSVSTQTGVTCGVPSAWTTAMWASWGSLSRAMSSSLRIAMNRNLPRAMVAPTRCRVRRPSLGGERDPGADAETAVDRVGLEATADGGGALPHADEAVAGAVAVGGVGRGCGGRLGGGQPGDGADG